MISKVVRSCISRINPSSKPFLVTDGTKWWVEDAPNHARMPPACSEREAERIWDSVVAALRPKLQFIPLTGNNNNNNENRRAPDSH